jgi:hypothetical protein
VNVGVGNLHRKLAFEFHFGSDVRPTSREIHISKGTSRGFDGQHSVVGRDREFALHHHIQAFGTLTVGTG